MTRHRASTLLALIAGLGVAGLTLTGCLVSVRADPTAPPERTADSTGVSPALRPFYEQDLQWRDCGSGFDCTTVTAPLDWEAPAAGTVDLAVIRHRADGPVQGSLLTNPGGPGASGVALIRDSLDFAVGTALQEEYDIIGFDPRGVGDSTAVRCYDAAAMDEYLFGIPSAPRHSPQWEEQLTARNAGFARACEAASGGILPYITTVQAARDMDLLRAVLGDETLNYLGYSYGTFLGATYAELYPDRVGRMVLDGAIDPSTSGLEVGTAQGVGFESALRSYMASCLAEGADCPFAGSVDEGMADLGDLLARVDASPLPNGDGRMLGADALLTAVIAALYSQDSWPYLTTALAQVRQGEATAAFDLADFYYNRADGRYLDNSTEAFTAYNCMDYPHDESPDEQAAADARLAAEAPTVAPYWSTVDVCDTWQYPATGVRGPIAAAGAAPILVIGTTNDPATPYAWSVALADQLSSGILITRVGEGHTGYNKGDRCVDGAVEAYFRSGQTPAGDLRCG